jgi:hypothetical protein
MESWNQKVKKMNWVDIQFIKISVALFTLFVVSFLGNYFNTIVSWRWWWLIFALIFAIKPMHTVFSEKDNKKKKKSKKGAVELSVGTIVIIVIAITMLVFGIVFVRSIMCSAINISDELGKNAEKEISKLFGVVGGEIQCVGGGGDAVPLIPGRVNIVWCGIRAEQTKQYEIKVKEIQGSFSDSEELREWIVAGDDSWSGNVKPGEEAPKKILRLNVPKDADEESIIITVEATRDSEPIFTQELDFEVQRLGVIRSAMC